MRKDRRDDEYQPPMPPVDAEHLLGYLFEIGPALFDGMGATPLTHAEIAAWKRNTGVALASWEARFMLRLSREYVSQLAASKKPDCKAPWTAAGDEVDRREVAASLQRMIGGLRNL